MTHPVPPTSAPAPVASAPPRGGDPPLDEARLAELSSEVGPDDLGAVLRMFLDEATDAADALAAGLDDEGRARATHMIRSGALNIGLSALAHGAACRADRPEAATALPRLVAEARAAVDARWPAAAPGRSAA